MYLEGNYKKVFIGTFYIVTILYIINTVSPLRLHFDSLRYFAIVECLLNGCPPLSEAAQDYLPYGYTFSIIMLFKLGIANSQAFIILNYLFLFVSIKGLYIIFDKKLNFYTLSTFILLSWVVIKFSIHPLSEMQYLFFSVLCLLYLGRFLNGGKLNTLILAISFACLAFLTRTVGVTLVLTIVLSVIWKYKNQFIQLLRKNRFIILGLTIILFSVIIFSKTLGLDHYSSVLLKQFSEGVDLGLIYQWHFTEWSEIILNISGAKILNLYPGLYGNYILIIIGFVSFLVFLYFFWIVKKEIPIYIKFYVIIYTILIFHWPFYDPRFWAPIIPFIIAIFIFAFKKIALNRKKIFALYIFIFTITGLASLLYYNYSSLNKIQLAKTQANGVYKKEYLKYFQSETNLSDTTAHYNDDIYKLIIKYN